MERQKEKILDMDNIKEIENLEAIGDISNLSDEDLKEISGGKYPDIVWKFAKEVGPIAIDVFKLRGLDYMLRKWPDLTAKYKSLL